MSIGWRRWIARPLMQILPRRRHSTFPAVQLFVERVGASGGRFELNDDDAPIVSEICRKLDGIALAIELAAGRANAYSVQETMAQLNDRFRLLWEGRRTALPRHQTMHATIEWSYDLVVGAGTRGPVQALGICRRVHA